MISLNILRGKFDIGREHRNWISQENKESNEEFLMEDNYKFYREQKVVQERTSDN